MKRIKKTLTLVSMAVLLLTACESPKELGVVPYPQYAQTTSKTVELPSTVTFSTNLAKSDMNDLLAYLPDFAIPMKLVNKNPFVTIEITDATDNPIAAEGYNLTVSKQGVNIQASSAAGAFYGLQTLAQLARNGKELPVTTIKDEPRFPYRGLHLDVSRHFFNTDYVKKQIDLVGLFARFAFVSEGVLVFEAVTGYLAIALGALAWWFGITFFVNKVRTQFNLRGIWILNRIIGSIVIVVSVLGLVFTLMGESLY